MPTPLAEMPFHARFAGKANAETPLGRLIFEHEAQVVADHDAGRITDADFDAFYQKASENLDRLSDLSARAREADRESSDADADGAKEFESIKKDDEATASDAFRGMQEVTRNSIEAAGEKLVANSEYQHGWPAAARDLIELRATFENADAAALDRDRTLVAEREQKIDADYAPGARLIAVETAKNETYLSHVDALADFEQRRNDIVEQEQAAVQEHADFDRRREELNGEKAGIDPNDPDGPQRVADIDQSLVELRAAEFEYSRESHATRDVETLQLLESQKDYVRALTQPGVESRDSEERAINTVALNRELAEIDQRIEELRADMATRSNTIAERDAALAELAAKEARNEELQQLKKPDEAGAEEVKQRIQDRAEELAQLKERGNSVTEANSERFEENRRSNKELEQEIDAVKSELMQRLKEGVAEEESRTAEVASRLATRLNDGTADISTEPAARDQASIDRLADIDRLEATLAELRGNLTDQIESQVRDKEVQVRDMEAENRLLEVQNRELEAQIREQEALIREKQAQIREQETQIREQQAVKPEQDDQRQTDAARPAEVRAGVEPGSASRNDGGAGGDAGGPNGASDPSVVIDAELYVEGAVFNDVEYADALYEDVEVNIAEPDTGNEGAHGTGGQSAVIEAVLFIDAEHPDAADPDVEMRSSADRITGDEVDAAGAT